MGSGDGIDHLRQMAGERLLENLFSSIQDGITILDTDMRIITVNPAVERLQPHAMPLVGKRCFEAYHLRQEPCPGCPSLQTLRSGSAARETVAMTGPAGQVIGWLDIFSFPLRDVATGKMTGVIEYVRDISAQKRAEEERQKLEDQLAQSQKMEAVGRLAGGVAHDFNNLLTVILGRTDLLLHEVPEAHPWAAELRDVLEAARCAAALTQQLLAFSRRQVIAPHPLDLDGVVDGSRHLIERLIGEDIQVMIVPGDGLHRVMADAHQIEQVLVNLVVNARDAMPDGGKLTIETSNMPVDEEYCRNHPEARPGSYAMLSVSDSGTGMTEEVKAHLFEPFFTTKGRGQGSGLGLSTVYGIVRQNSGFINVYSEPGVGSTFKVFLPCTDLPAEQAEPLPSGTLERGEESILLVEDSELVRNFALRALQELGYQVVPAANADEALRCFEAKRVDLLLTDVILPGMNGKALYQVLRQRCAKLRVLYISGYTDNVVAHRGILEPGIPFLQKPFTMLDLARKLREVLRT